ncbi:MAG: hypothetical protein KC636_19280 [Myxococcales bacterium]|nr:hypothetical protein [Myxococcales bacterium]
MTLEATRDVRVNVDTALERIGVEGAVEGLWCTGSSARAVHHGLIAGASASATETALVSSAIIGDPRG